MIPAPAMRLSNLLRGAGVTPLTAPECDPVIRQVGLDSRSVGPDSLFCALRGLHSNGEQFVQQAVRQGASAVLAASPRPADLDPAVAWLQVDDPRMQVAPLSRELYGRPDEAMKLVGITGTNGKTTTAYMVDAIVRAAGRNSGRVGTIDYAWNDVQRPAPHTTPEGPDLFALLAEMRDEGVEWVAMEVSSHALCMGRVRSARFDVAAFLNLRRDHLDFHQDVDSYLEAKSLLFRSLDPDDTAILNADDPMSAAVADRTCARVLTFGRNPAADIQIRSDSSTVSGSRAILATPWGELPIFTPLAGPFNLENAAAAAACTLAGGLNHDAVRQGVETLAAVPGRMERVDRGGEFAVFVDYAHTDDALSALLAAARNLASGRVLVVFGCGGDRDRGKRAAMGATAARMADLLFPTSDNPRNEQPEAILAEVEEGIATVPGGPTRSFRALDREEAIRLAVASARPGDVLVIAGKGHETTQTTAGRTQPFDDREVARRILGEARHTGRDHAEA
ncbi:MAG: UDP-N-acetylmuramoyl-L-alanyl-D-glutamate--2,6-diaminopimelate ligase [Acidobacteria bacterium]|uniref:UDP-N-acetylmuramoyl-L-alanyl-D-glutamate--2,6-diaminopimelate ligase n=1 Tax=Candidatus Polarisedimenticola svalbardensis TaxID=2886004 RepID=A0A8J6XU25_9BACT|nr:UDP-N-acetylmuramoyl-L-alanyl-D-glutamate--2,6-diaminopimelate ligase [Candidatus Polarisedimenticola svalbardensis]